MTMNELIEHVAGSTGMGREGVKKILDASIAAIIDKAGKAEDVVLAGFGQFKIRDTPARTGRNPGTGEAIDIAAARKLVFVPAKAVKDAVNKK